MQGASGLLQRKRSIESCTVSRLGKVLGSSRDSFLERKAHYGRAGRSQNMACRWMGTTQSSKPKVEHVPYARSLPRNGDSMLTIIIRRAASGACSAFGVITDWVGFKTTAKGLSE